VHNSDELNAMPLDELFESLADHDELDRLIGVGRREDVGETGDVTSDVFIPADCVARAEFRARQPGRLAGAAILPFVAAAYDADLTLESHLLDGAALKPGDVIATVGGALRSVLTAERVMLNFLTHLSGIATLTAQHVDAVAGTNARIYDTRKTIPGMRSLAKYAVRCGGGFCHRIGLYDAVLVKDNHIAHIPAESLRDTLAAHIADARRREPAPSFVEIEVDTLEQLRRVLTLDVDIVLLDNMGPDMLRESVAMRDAAAPRVELEASGGINLDTVRAAAETGVDRIAIGALTHSAPSLDIGLDIAPRRR